MNGQPLRGFVGQSMSGSKDPITPESRAYPVGSHTFTVPKSGIYRFVLWGAGGGGADAKGGGSGAFILAERPLAAGQSVAISVGAPSLTASSDGGNGGSTTVTLPNGDVLSAGGGAGATSGGGAGGTASGFRTNLGDVAYDGSAGGGVGSAGSAGLGENGGASGAALDGISGGGAGAPGARGYVGAAGGAGQNATPVRNLPGVGAGGGSNNPAGNIPGGCGQVIVIQVKITR